MSLDYYAKPPQPSRLPGFDKVRELAGNWHDEFESVYSVEDVDMGIERKVKILKEEAKGE